MTAQPIAETVARIAAAEADLAELALRLPDEEAQNAALGDLLRLMIPTLETTGAAP